MWKKVLIAIGVVALGLGFLMTRTAELFPSGATVDEARLERGRALLDALAETHGRAALMSHATIGFEMADRWSGMGSMANPYELETQKFDVVVSISSNNGRFVLTNGPDAGLEWGMRDRRGYRKPKGGSVELPPAEEVSGTFTADFMFPTYRYFVLLPFEISTAEYALALEPIEEGGKTYQRVLATWGSLEANDEFDQYVVWIDRISGRLSRIDYTIREMGASSLGFARYGDYVEVGGVWIPGSVETNAVMPGGLTSFIHEVTVHSPTFDVGL